MTLTSKTFEFTHELLKFVKDNHIQKGDIQAITHSFNMKGSYPDTSFTMFYWEMDAQDPIDPDKHMMPGEVAR